MPCHKSTVDAPILQFTNCRILKDHVLQREDLWVRAGKILNPEKVFFDEKKSADVQLDCKGSILAPGFIDVQINGGFGVDFSLATDDAQAGISLVSQKILSSGVTSFCPTMVTSPSSVYHKVLPQIRVQNGGPHGAGVLGMESEQPDDSALEKLDPVNMMRHNTALLFRDLRLGASALVGSLMDKTEALRKSASETSLKGRPLASHKDSRKKSQTCQDFLGSSDVQRDPGSTTPEPEDQPTFFFSDQDREAFSSGAPRGLMFPDGFQPLRSSQPAASLPLELSPIVKNPFMSPLLAPDEMLKGLPPVYIVACALDPMLDDSVMFAQRLRALGQPVTLRVVQDLPHGFLSLSQLCRETRQASAVCIELIRNVLVPSDAGPPQPPATLPKHRKLERTSPAVAANAHPAPVQENGVPPQHKMLHTPAAESRAARPNEEVQTTSKTPEPQTGGRSLDQPNKSKNISTPPTASPILNAAIIPGQDSGPSSSTSGRGIGA